MANPTPVPAKLRLLNGKAPGRDSGGRVVKETPGFTRLPPVAPNWLPNEARAEWDRVVPELQRLQLTKTIDGAALSAYCLAWSRVVAAQAIINAEGILSENSQGKVRHPAVLALESATRELMAWTHEFGLTPSAEQRVAKQTDAPPDSNPFT